METGKENRGGEGSPPGAEGDQRRPAPIYTQENFWKVNLDGKS